MASEPLDLLSLKKPDSLLPFQNFHMASEPKREPKMPDQDDEKAWMGDVDSNLENLPFSE